MLDDDAVDCDRDLRVPAHGASAAGRRRAEDERAHGGAVVVEVMRRSSSRGRPHARGQTGLRGCGRPYPGPPWPTGEARAFLARQMGVELVEASDLVVRDDLVHMRTTDGLQRVHAVYRRLDDDVIDPLEFCADSGLGAPGLVRARRPCRPRAATACCRRATSTCARSRSSARRSRSFRRAQPHRADGGAPRACRRPPREDRRWAPLRRRAAGARRLPGRRHVALGRHQRPDDALGPTGQRPRLTGSGPTKVPDVEPR
jgi:circularly permuted ATPgrasp domain protein